MIWNNFILPLILTVIIEAAAAWLFKVRKPSDLLTVVLANAITNPLINLLNYLMFHFGMDDSVRHAVLYLALEPLVVVVEALIYRYNLDEDVNGWLLSVAANLLSIIGGLVCWNMF